MSQRQDSILEPLHAKAANPFSDVHVTIKALFKNAKIIIDVSSTRKIVPPAKPVDCENVSWSECPSQVQDTVVDPIGSKSIASCNKQLEDKTIGLHRMNPEWPLHHHHPLPPPPWHPPAVPLFGGPWTHPVPTNLLVHLQKFKVPLQSFQWTFWKRTLL